MFTKIEQAREKQGLTTAREVFVMPEEAESKHYVKKLFHERLEYAEETADRVIKLLEGMVDGRGGVVGGHIKFGGNADGAQRARVIWETRQNIYDLLEIYQVHETFQQYATDIVQAHFLGMKRKAERVLGRKLV